jgi:hypothetical protein
MALEISDHLLRNKTRRGAGKPTTPDDVVFRDLARTIAGSPERFARNPERWIGQARYKYAKISERMTLRIMTAQFPDAAEVWLKPSQELVDQAKRHDPDCDAQNFRIMGMVLLRTAHDALPPEQWEKLRRSAPLEYQNDLENMQRMLRWERVGSKTDRAALAQEAYRQSKSMRQALDVLIKRWRGGDAPSLRVEARRLWSWVQGQLESSCPAALSRTRAPRSRSSLPSSWPCASATGR